MIGIVGGIGPLAGVDLYKRILEHTVAESDQDHLPVFLASLPGDIPDRTKFLLDHIGENPAEGIAQVIHLLENAGAHIIAIACNTAHAPAIFIPLEQRLKAMQSKVKIIHLIDITTQAIQTQSADLQKIGILSTSGAYQAKIYQTPLETSGMTPVLLPFDRHTELVHKAIYQIKISGESVPPTVIHQLNTAIQELETLGAQAVILGCTEIGMIEHLLDFRSLTPFNPNTIMARALIAQHSPHKLRRLTAYGGRPTVDGGR